MTIPFELPNRVHPKHEIARTAMAFYMANMDKYASPDCINLQHGDLLFPPHPVVKEELQKITQRSIFSDKFLPGNEVDVHKLAGQGVIFLQNYRWPSIIAPEMLEAALGDFHRGEIPVSRESEVIVGCGITQLFNGAMYALVPEGGKILVPIPTYGIFVAQAGRMGVNIQAVDTYEYIDGNKIIPEKLGELIGEDLDIKGLFFINPDNPTGALYSKKELEAIGRELLKNRPIPIIVDEVNNRLILDPSNTHTSFASLTIDGERMFDRTVTFRGVSKGYGLARIRIGYACGPQEIIAPITKKVFADVYGASEVDQLLAAAAVAHTPDEYFNENNNAYRKKRDFVSARISTINENMNVLYRTEATNYVTVSQPIAGQFQVVSLKPLLGAQTKEGIPIANDMDLAVHLIQNGVSFIPGSAIGYRPDEMKLRLTFTSSDRDVIEGLTRLEKTVLALKLKRT